MQRILYKFLLTLFLISFTGMIQAREPYRATVTVGSDAAAVSAPNLVNLSRDLKSSSITALLPLYTPVSPVLIDINLRGIDVISSFAANSTALDVVIPQAGIIETFDGGSRDASIKLFKDFVRDGGTRGRLLKAYYKYSPIDPIAGNPNSLLSQMAQADYLVGHLSPLSGCDCCWGAQPIVHQFQVGLNVNRSCSRGFDTTAVSIPLRYSYSPNLNWAFILDAPLTYYRNGGASSAFGSLGIGLRVPVTHRWSLTPTIRAGSGGTLDLCTSGSFLSAGLVSVYNYKLCDYVLTMTNYAGYYTSTNLWLTGVNFNYHLQNYIFKNGLAITTCKGYKLCSRLFNVGLSFVDSYFTKRTLFIRHYDEVGFNIFTTCLNPRLDYDCLTFGFAYQFGQKNFHGYNFNLVYQF